MHKLLMNHVLSKIFPFSIIIDSSTDSQETQHLVKYFQILEKKRPRRVIVTHCMAHRGQWVLHGPFHDPLHDQLIVRKAFIKTIYFDMNVADL